MRNELLFVAALIVTPMASCHQQPATAAVQPLPETRIVFPDGFAVGVEVAADDPNREQGLMYRDRLAENAGMIFIFPRVAEYSFWMKNTIIPLDMIWIDDQHRIVRISSDVPPCKADPCPSYPPKAQARYVLEVAAGVAKKHHLAEGATLRFDGLDHVVVR